MPDDHSKLVPLLPIPNRTVKRLCANDSADSRVKVGHCQATHPRNAQLKNWAFFFVRPAWAHSYGCKSRRKLITTSEVKRNCMRATECGKEAWNINCEPMNKNRI